MTIADLENMKDGEAIAEITLTVKAAYPPKSPKAPWSLLCKDDTGEVRVSYWSSENLADLKGKTITLKSSVTRKGLDGLSAAFSDYSNKWEIKAFKNAQLFEDGELPNVPAKTGTPKPTVSPINAADAKKVLFQAAQLMVEAIKAAEWVGSQVTLTPEHLQAVASSLFISGDRAGLAKSFPLTAGKQKETPKQENKDNDDDDLGW